MSAGAAHVNGEGAPEAVQHADHFASLEQQEHASHLGMWLFLTSEVLLFGALFGLYTAYRIQYTSEFAEAAHHNNLVLGTANTFLLITSSFLAAWAVHAVQHERHRTVVASLAATILLGAVFLALKFTEYSEHFSHGIFPGGYYSFAELPSRGANIFFTLYFFMTGLHALHVIGGMGALSVVLVMALYKRYSKQKHTSLELSVVYWHLVDAVWIFLWPLMYLVG
jgi:cytochrome c oxidase subunit III